MIGLSNLSTQTGGRFFNAPDSDGIEELYTLISNQLNNLYELQWEINEGASSGDLVTVVIAVTYTAANGTFTDTAINSYQIP